MVIDADRWRQIAQFLLDEIPNLTECADLPVQEPASGPPTLSLLYRFPPHRTLNIAPGKELVLSAEAQQHLSLQAVADYPAERSVLIVAEPHYDLARQANLLRGLEVLSAENPPMRDGNQTVFLAEGFPTGQRLVLDSLIKAEPRLATCCCRTSWPRI